jgi:hypothetical protein
VPAVAAAGTPRSEVELLADLEKVPELRMFGDQEVLAGKKLLSAARVRRQVSVSPFLLKLHEDLVLRGVREGLPLKKVLDSQMSPVAATVMGHMSKELRDKGFVSIPLPGTVLRTTPNLGPDEKAQALEGWCGANGIVRNAGALPCLLQMLQTEDEPVRLVLIKELCKVPHRATTRALCQRAVFDVSANVREAACDGLSKRNPQHYMPILGEALRYPWLPVSEHAAQAICKLRPERAEEYVQDCIDKGDPLTPVTHPRNGKKVVPELVRLNHLRNCALCHLPSAQKEDPARGFMPVAGEPLPRLYYAQQELSGDFVRADVTLLHQHFSVNLPVPAEGKWPTTQRFDFVTRLRTARPSEIAIGGRPDFSHLTVMRKTLENLADIRKVEPLPKVTTVPRDKKWGQMTREERLKRLEGIIEKDPPANQSKGLTDEPLLENVTIQKKDREPVRKP